MKDLAIRAIVTPAVERVGLEVDRVEVSRAGRRSVLRIALDGDGPSGLGPSLDEIAAATRAISEALDASDAVGDAPYVLEVSSRGVGRPLTEPKHFRRNVTRLVDLALSDGSTLTGRIAAASASGIDLDVDGRARSVAFGQIARAVVQVELRRREDDADEDEE